MLKIVLAFILFIESGFISLGFSQALSDSVVPFKIGEIEKLHSLILNEDRVINIYLPLDYSHTDSIKYNVIYLLDGSADEDFIHVAGLVQFNTFEWVNVIPKSIVVGISNTDRKRDFTFPSTLQEEKKQWPTTGGSANFISFIENELQPFIQNKYHVSNDKTLIGQSLGGLLACEILLTKNELFNRYIIVSPSLWWDNGSLMNKCSTFCNQSVNKNLNIYIGVGKEGPTPGQSKRTMEKDAEDFYQKLLLCKSKNTKLYFDYLPNENHATIGHIAVFNAMRLIYK